MERDDYFFVDGEPGTEEEQRAAVVAAEPESAIINVGYHDGTTVEEPFEVFPPIHRNDFDRESKTDVQNDGRWISICKTSTEGLHGEHGVVDLMQNSVTKEVRAFPVQ